MEQMELSPHEQVKKLKRELTKTVVFLLAALAVLVISTVAWFMNSRRNSGFGIAIEAENGKDIQIDDTVTAIRTYLSDDKDDVTLTLQRGEDGFLEVVAPDSYENQDSTILFSKMIPGEYVDLSFTVDMNENMDGKQFTLYLSNILLEEVPTDLSAAEEAYGWFGLPGEDGNIYYHNVLGIYTYQIMDMVSTAQESSILTEETQPEFFGSFSANQNDDAAPAQIVLYRGIWRNSYGKLKVNLRFKVDFSQFYMLLKETGSDISNVLSQKGFEIQTIGISTE